MSREKRSLRIGKRERTGAIIGAMAGALMGGCIAVGTGPAAASDIFVTAVKWAVALAIVGMWIRLSMIIDVVIWAILGAVAGLIASLILGAMGLMKLEIPDSLIYGATIGIFISVLGNSLRKALMWHTSDQPDAGGKRG